MEAPEALVALEAQMDRYPHAVWQSRSRDLKVNSTPNGADRRDLWLRSSDGGGRSAAGMVGD
jgi:hypothetical protein